MYRLTLNILIVVCISFPLSTHAAWTGYYNIKSLKMQTNGTNLTLEGFVNSEPDINCGSNGFWMPETEQNYQARTSMLLAAYLSGVPVKLSYYGCEAGLIKMGSVQIEK